LVFIPKYPKKAILGSVKKRLGEMFHDPARRRKSKIEARHPMADHVHMVISIPPKYSVAEVIGLMKGKSSILPRIFADRTAQLPLMSWWPRS
jgi:putative transposase